MKILQDKSIDMKIFSKLYDQISSAKVEFDNVYPNIPGNDFDFDNDPFGKITFNGNYKPAIYSSILDNIFNDEIEPAKEYFNSLSLHQSISELNVVLTKFQSIKQRFYTIRLIEATEPYEVTFRDDIEFDSYFELGSDKSISTPFHRRIAPFINLQKAYTLQVLSFLVLFKEQKLSSLMNEDVTLRQIIDLPSDFKIQYVPDPETVSRLDIRQVALLFDYLRKHNAIRNLNNNYLAKLVHHLTGYSEHNLRTVDGFGMISLIARNKHVHQSHRSDPHYNSIKIKELLEEIIESINKEIEKS